MKRLSGWGGRLARRWWPDRNPVRRRWDRMEAAIVAALITAFRAGAPVAAIAADGWAYGVARHVQQSQWSGWRRVPAVLTADAPQGDNSEFAGGALAGVHARWTAPDGARRAGQVLAQPGAKAGSRVLVWVNGSGQLTGRPLLDHQVTEQALLAAVVTAARVGMVRGGAGARAHRMLDARRMAAWDAEWRETGPRWSPRH